jgi:hypothetical protein
MKNKTIQSDSYVNDESESVIRKVRAVGVEDSMSPQEFWKAPAFILTKYDRSS